MNSTSRATNQITGASSPEAEDRTKTPWVWLGILTALAAVLRAIDLNSQLWLDEIDTLVNSVRSPLFTILTSYQSQNQHMFYSVLAWFSLQLFGESAWALRVPAAFFGVAAVPALYFFARRVATQREALLSAALMAASYHAVWFSQNARGYTGLLFFTLLTTYFFLRGTREPGWGPWWGYAIGMALGMYTHLTMAFVAAGHGLVYLWWVADRRRQEGHWPEFAGRALAGFLLAGFLALVLYGPVLPGVFSRTVVATVQQQIEWEWKNPLWMIRETLRGLSRGAGLGLPAVAAGGLVVLAGLGSFLRRDRYGVGLMIMPGMVTAMVMLAVGHNLWPRFFFFAVGFAFVLLVRGAMACGEAVAGWRKRDAAFGLRLGTALAVLIIAASAWSVREAYRHPKQDYVGAMEFVESQQQPGDVVATLGLTSFPYERYYGRNWPAVKDVDDIDALRSKARRVWVLYTFPIYTGAKYPDLWDLIHDEFTTVRVFPGTVGDGEIYVCRWF